MKKCFIFILVFLSVLSYSQDAQNYISKFNKIEKMIKMRDGVQLNTEILVPKNIVEPLPFIILRTPYGISGLAERYLNGYFKELADDGYIFVFQDIRGKFKSEGAFIMLHPMRNNKDPKSIDESTDTYDSIDWLLKNIPHNNGRAGMLGISYSGWLTVMALLDPHSGGYVPWR
jgi:putative CocE/NonD family hydrolase